MRAPAATLALLLAGPALAAPRPASAPAPAKAPVKATPAKAKAPARPAKPPAPKALPFVEDDYPRALAQARARNVPLVVDVWAPW